MSPVLTRDSVAAEKVIPSFILDFFGVQTNLLVNDLGEDMKMKVDIYGCDDGC